MSISLTAACSKLQYPPVLTSRDVSEAFRINNADVDPRDEIEILIDNLKTKMRGLIKQKLLNFHLLLMMRGVR